MKTVNTMLLLLALFARGVSQEYRWKAYLERVPANGYYRILLSPAAKGQAREDLSDIRLVGSSGELPYFSEQKKKMQVDVLFREYRILSRKAKKGCCTELVIENPGKAKISNLILRVRNADVIKKGRLSGSEDLKNWYVLRNEYTFHSIGSNLQTYNSRPLEFPLTDYRYLRAEISDSTSGPVDILAAGYYDTVEEKGIYTECARPSLAQKDSNKISYVKIRFPASQYLDRLDFGLRGPVSYLRNARLCVEMERNTHKHRHEKYFETIRELRLSSIQQNSVDLDGISYKELWLLVDNKDDTPLILEEVRGYQLGHYLVAYLHKAQTYSLKLGSSSAQAPEYDILHFRDSILKSNPPVILSGALVSITMPRESSRAFFTSGRFIWISLAAVIAMLGIMSFRVVKDIGRKS